MEYTQAAREVLAALQTVREADDIIWCRGALGALDLLFPTSAVAWALHRPEVWQRDLRLEVLRNPSPEGAGCSFDDLVEAAETAAAADGAPAASELHLAHALAQVGASGLSELGVDPTALVRAVLERVGAPPRSRVKLARPTGAARADVLQTLLGDVDVDDVLNRKERTGTVERKQSIDMGDDGRRDAYVDRAVALVNGNRESLAFLIFGQSDDGSIVGEVNHRGEPLSPEAVRKSQRRFDQGLQACEPPVIVQWREVERDGRRVWLACLLGRERGIGVRTPRGAWPYRSAEDTYYAGQAMVAAWHREAIAEAEAIAPAETTAADASGEVGALLRPALRRLNEAVAAYFATPPDLPTSIQGGRKFDDWNAPVVQPILERFNASVVELAALGIAANADEVLRLGRGLRDVFIEREAHAGTTWLVNAPRLACRVVADQVMGEAYVTERLERVVAIARHPFDSHMGRLPWVVSPEYRHLESLGGDAAVATEMSVAYALAHPGPYTAAGVEEDGIRRAMYALGFGFALAKMAWDSRIGGVGYPAFALLGAPLWRELEVWEDEPSIVAAFAALSGEDADYFASRLPQRFLAIFNAVQGSGYYLGIADGAFAVVNRIGEAGQLRLEQRATSSEPL